MQWIGCTDFLPLPSRDGTSPYTSRVAPTSYRKKIPRIACRTCTVHVRVLGRRAILRHAHGHAYAAGGRRVSTSTILGASVAGILALTALLRPPQAQIRAPFTETAGAITSRRPSSDPPPTPSDSTLGSSAQSTVPMTNATPKPHPPKAEAPPTRRIRLKGVQWGSFGKPRNARL